MLLLSRFPSPPSALFLAFSVTHSRKKMEEEKAGNKTPDDELTARNVDPPPKMPESALIPTDDPMDFHLDEKALEELRKLLAEDIVAADCPPSEAAKIDDVGNPKKSGITSPETGTPSTTISDADMDDGISLSALLESTGKGTNLIPSAGNRQSEMEMDHIIGPTDKQTGPTAGADVASKGDDEWRERVLGSGEQNFAPIKDFEL